MDIYHIKKKETNYKNYSALLKKWMGFGAEINNKTFKSSDLMKFKSNNIIINKSKSSEELITLKDSFSSLTSIYTGKTNKELY